LPKLLKGAGYATGAFGKWHLSSNFLAGWEVSPHLHGFDVWRAGLPSNVAGCGGTGYFDWTRVDDGVSTTASEYQTYAVRSEFVDWWGETWGARFAYVCYQAAHKPFHVPPNQSQGPPGGDPCTNRGMYNLMVESLDEMIGDMLAVTDLSSTYFFFLADNGTPRAAIRADQDPDKVKRTTFRDGVNVPLIVAGPGVSHGASDGLVHAVDLMATIAELTGTSLPEHLNLDSRSFAAALEDPASWSPARQYVFCENDFGTRERAVITQRWKLRNAEGQEELYDLWTDPREEHPLDLNDPRRRDLLLCLRDILENPSSPGCTDIPTK
jgi:arylsulfatase A-like enzyme